MGASTLATLLIRLGFDTSSLGGGAAAARGAIASVGAAGPAAANQLNHAIDTVDNKLRSAANTANFLKTTLATALGFAGAGLLTTAINFAEEAMIGLNSKIEQARIGFTTMLGSAGAADEFIAKMQAFANVTPFEFVGLQEAVQRMLAVGFASDTVLQTLTDIGDAVAALGGSTEMLQRVVYVFGQMKTAGRLVGQDMMQLTSTGIPAWQMLADAMGKSIQQVRDLVTKGLIPADEAIEIITKGMQDRFGGMMQRQARTFQGAMSTIKDSATQAIAGAVKPLFDLLAAGMIGLADFLTNGGGKLIGPILMGIGAVLLGVVVPAILSTIGSMVALKVAALGITAPLIPLIAAVSLVALAFQENFGGIRGLIEANLQPLLFVLGAIATLLLGRWLAGLAASAQAMITATLSTTRMVAAEMALAGATTYANISMTQVAGTLGLMALPFAIVTAAVIALGAAFAWAKGQISEANATLTKQVNDFGAQASLEQLKTARAGILEEIDKIKNAPKIGSNLFETVGNALGDLFGMNGVQELQGQVGALDQLIATATANMAGNVETASGRILDATQPLIDQLGTSLADVAEAASAAGGEAMEAYAKGIAERRNVPMQALLDLNDMLNTQMTAQVEITRLLGELQTASLADGMKSADPAVRAQAVATQKFIVDRLNELTDGAYAAGLATGTALWEGLKAGLQEGDTRAEMIGTAQAAEQASGAWKKYSSEESAAAKYAADLDAYLAKLRLDAPAAARSLSNMASEAKASLGSAFDEIRDKARAFFDEQHRMADETLSAQQEAIQGTVDVFKAQIDAERALRHENELRKAITDAENPEELMRAQQALTDFLQDQQAQVMQENATAEIAKLQDQRDAEDKRFQDQVANFAKELTALRDHLEKHPGEWRKAQKLILDLLDSYGINYEDAGVTLGEKFVKGLTSQVEAAEAAARALAKAGSGAPAAPDKPKGPPVPQQMGTMVGGQFVPTYADGAWKLMQDQLAYLHAGEMVVPRNVAESLRAALEAEGKSGMDGLFDGQSNRDWKTLAAGGGTDRELTNSLNSQGEDGGGTLIVQVDGEVIARVSDKRMAIRDGLINVHAPGN